MGFFLCVFLDTCCSHFLTIIAGVGVGKSHHASFLVLHKEMWTAHKALSVTTVHGVC